MNVLFKLVFKFLRWGEAKFGTKAELIVTKMTTEPMLTLVADPLPATVATRVAGQAALADYKAAAQKAADGSKVAIKDRHAKRVILQDTLTGWGGHLVLAAKKAGDINILTESGFDLRQPLPNPTSNGIPAAPVIVLKRGAVSSSVGVRVKPVLKGVGSYEAQYTIGDPTVDANFNHSKTFKNGSRIGFADLELGKLHNIRVRGIGSKGPGDWSDPVGIIVT